MKKLLSAALLFSGVVPAQTVAECERHHHYGRLGEAQSCYQQLASSRNPLLRAEGQWKLGFTQQALESFLAAEKADPKNPDIKVRAGRFSIARWRAADAEEFFSAALALNKNHPGALLGMAILASEGFEAKAVEFAEKALAADPKLLEAQELIAKLAIEDVNFDKARQEAQKALQLSSESLDGMAVLAALDVLADKPTSGWFDRIDKINPAYAEGYAYVAHTLTINRRYLEAIEFFKKALEKNPRYWPAHSELGISYMRLGMDKDARYHLELAHNNGERGPSTTNTLNLMDSYKNFDIIKTPHGEMRLQKKESALLKIYFGQELERAIATFEKKYQVKLKQPVRLEVYPNHDDFAVRTMGMPGLGALGVTFGAVVAMDSPSGRKPGSFHWAGTLWHELSHVYALEATNHRVPRWFTEGLAVHEESAASPEWGDRLDTHMLGAVRDRKLLPVTELDRGFIRPKYPMQVIVSYFQGGRICDYINSRWGWQTLLDMLHSFAENKTTADVIQLHLKISPEQFDKDFLAWLDKQLATPLAKFADWQKGYKSLVQLAQEKRSDDANRDRIIEEGLKIRDWFPEYVEDHSVYEILADAYTAKGAKKLAAEQLERYAKVGGRNPAMLKRLAALDEELGRPKEAISALEKLNYVYPVADPEMHQKLGVLCLNNGNVPMAIREFQAALASRPLDPAASYYQLAQAYMKANRVDDAKEQVINALESAPGYKPAQRLLLELSSRPEKH